MTFSAFMQASIRHPHNLCHKAWIVAELATVLGHFSLKPAVEIVTFAAMLQLDRRM